MNQYIFPVAHAGDTVRKTIYLRLNNGGYHLEAPVYVGTRKGMQVLQQKEDWVVALYVGAILIMLCYNLVIFLTTKQLAYLYYIIYLSSLAISATAVNGGYAQFWLYKDYGYLGHYFYAFNCINSFFFLQFVHSFLRVKVRASSILKVSYTIFFAMLCIAIVNVAAGITGNYQWWDSYLVNGMLALVSVFYLSLLVLVVQSWRRGKKYAGLLLVGWSVFFGSMWLAILSQTLGWIEYSFWTTKIGLVGSFIEILLFSLALSQRMNQLKEEKREAQAAALRKVLEKKEIIEGQKKKLEKKVEARAFELNMLNENLQQKQQELHAEIDSKNRVMSLVANDLATPLSSIHDIARDEKLNGNSHWDHIREQVENGRRLIRDLKTVTNVEANLIEHDREEIEVISLIEKVVSSYGIEAAKKDIDLETEYHVESAKASTVYNSLRRVIENLLSNALKFTPKGGEVKVVVQEWNGTLSISICDSGPGFSEEDKKMMFRKFQRLSARPTNKESSTGLGLSIVKMLCDKLGAELDLVSTPGEGAQFTVEFPKILSS